MKKRTTCILIGITTALFALGLGAWWLAGLTPSWYAPVEPDDPAAIAIGQTAEYRLVEEFQKIRPPDDVWRLRIPEDAINAWLATRLPQWLDGQGMSWPDGLGTPQVHIAPSGIVIGVPNSSVGGRMTTLRLKPKIVGNQLHCAVSAGVGRLPIPIAIVGIDVELDESSNSEDPLRYLQKLLNGHSIDALIPLVDRRIVTIQAVDLENESMIVKAATSLTKP